MRFVEEKLAAVPVKVHRVNKTWFNYSVDLATDVTKVQLQNGRCAGIGVREQNMFVYNPPHRYNNVTTKHNCMPTGR